jgi:hypothetical protein
MKTYLAQNYSNYETLINDIAADLNENIKLPISATHKMAGQCSIIEVSPSISDINADLILTTELLDKTIKKYSFRVLTQKEYLSLSENDMQLLTSYLNTIKDVQIELSAILTEQARLQREAEKKAEEERKAEEKYQKLKEKTIQDFDNLAKQERTKCATGEFYYNLGWLAKNIGTISAALPDYLLGAFERYFGTDYTPTVVDSRKKTINGNPMQWAMSMKASIAKKAQETIPALFNDYLNPAHTTLTSTSFIWDLVDNYGFSFGKKQDVEKIKASIPTTYLSQFEAGYAI